MDDKSVTGQLEQAIRHLNMCLGENGLKTVVMESTQAEMSQWINEEALMKAFHQCFQDYRIDEKSKLLSANQTDRVKTNIEVANPSTTLVEFLSHVENVSKTMKEIGASIETKLFDAPNSFNLKSSFKKEEEEAVLHC